MNQRDLQRIMKGRRPWLTRASVASGIAGATLAGLYGALTLEFPPGTVGPFFGFVGLALAVATVVGEVLAIRSLPELRKAGTDEGKADDATLEAILREASAAPDFLFRNNLINWAWGATSVGVLLKIFYGTSWELLIRITLLGVIFGPMSSALAYVLTVNRVRTLITLLSRAGMSAQVASRGLPARHQLFARLLTFVGISLVTTVVLAADVTSTLTSHSTARIAALTDGHLQLAAADALNLDLIAQLGLLAAGVFALTILTAAFAGAAIASPMQAVSQIAQGLAKGEIGALELIPAEDEMWTVSANFSRMHASLREAVDKLKVAGIRIGSTTEQLVATSSQYEHGATSQATALNQTSATTEELARSARQVAENAASVSEIAQKTLAAARTGKDSAEDFNRAMNRVRQDNQAISESVVKLARRVQQIGKVVSFINSVADRSDLLALNAELEGTKAGEVGRGFSLVAGEMRRLAENVIESTREIEELIEEIREATGAAVAATETGVHATESGTALATDVMRSLEQILENAEKTSASVRAISLATQQQQTGTDQLADAMTDILNVTQQSLAASKQVTVSNGSLAILSRELMAVVNRFQLGSKG